MDLNPIDGVKKAYHAIRSGIGDVGRAADSAEAGAGRAWDSFVRRVETLPPVTAADSLVDRVKRAQSQVPHEGPFLAPPEVPPLDQPAVAVRSGTPAELLPGEQSLTPGHPAIAVTLTGTETADGQLTVKAAAPGTDWGQAGRESATMSVFVDGHYNQDLVLYGGATPTSYPVALGALPPGPHTITFAFNQPGSTAGATGITLQSAQVALSGQDEQGMVERYQPYLHGRGMDNIHSDVPLYMWAEVEHRGADTLIHYNVIHSNEDGGTAATPLVEQATWGRMTDPDPICTVTVGPDGQPKGVSYEGANDRFLEFKGRWEGDHPALRVSTTNNDYSDQGSTPLLFRPRAEVQHFGPGQSREDLMDRMPWMYRICNEEVTREGKVMTDQQASTVLAQEGQPGFKPPTKLEDLRNYLYVQYGTGSGASPVAVEVKLKGRDQWFRSDLTEPQLDIGGPDLPPILQHHFFSNLIPGLLRHFGYDVGERSGDGIRTSVPLPPGAKAADVESIRFVDQGDRPVPFQGLEKAFMLDDQYEPHYLQAPAGAGTLRPGAPITIQAT